jgi:hypothetical protein
VISRPLVIILAFVAASMRAAQGAWQETIGLAALGSGLVILKLAETRPALRQYAYLCFLLTGASVVLLLFRQYL